MRKKLVYVSFATQLTLKVIVEIRLSFVHSDCFN